MSELLSEDTAADMSEEYIAVEDYPADSPEAQLADMSEDELLSEDTVADMSEEYVAVEDYPADSPEAQLADMSEDELLSEDTVADMSEEYVAVEDYPADSPEAQLADMSEDELLSEDTVAYVAGEPESAGRSSAPGTATVAKESEVSLEYGGIAKEENFLADVEENLSSSYSEEEENFLASDPEESLFDSLLRLLKN